MQVRRQIARTHENMVHSSNRTLVRVLRLGGARRRFVLAAKHSCGACGTQKRPAGPNVSPNSVVNDVVGLDLFILNTYGKHTLPAMNIVCWGTGLQRVVPLRDQSGETFGCDHTESPASLSSISNAACALAFLQNVESEW